MQKRNGSSRGKAPARLMSGTCATIALNPTTVSSSCCVVFVEFKGGSAKAAAVVRLVVVLSFLLIACALFPLPAGLMPASSYSSCCFVRATNICSSLSPVLFLWPFLSDVLASHSSEHLSFSCFFLFFLWSGLFCCVLVPVTLAFHLIYLGELRLYGLLCPTVFDHIISLSRMKNQRGH